MSPPPITSPAPGRARGTSRAAVWAALAAAATGVGLAPAFGPLAGAVVPRAAAAEVEPIEHAGRLAPGDTFGLALPAAPGKLWFVTLEADPGAGEADDLDLDLRVEGPGGPWSSAHAGPDEELLVPADVARRCVVVHAEGPAARIRLRAVPVTPRPLPRPGKAFAGRVGDEPPLLVFEVPTGSRWAHAVLSDPAAAEDVDLDLILYDAACRRALARSEGDAADEALVLGPTKARQWLVVRAWTGAARVALDVVPVEKPGRLRVDAPVTTKVKAGEERCFELDGGAPGVLIVKLEGPDGVDLDLHVHGPEGYARDSIDDDAREEVAINAVRGAKYLVRVVSHAEQGEAQFTLSAARLDLSRLAADGAGGPRTWGLFVGIAAYDGVERLTWTAQDALAVYQALRAHGQADPRRSIVLLDERARRADLVQALETIAARADEDDAFVLFFSGHGGNELEDGARGDPKDEADGKDESLVCFDSGTGEDPSGHGGELSDDDFKALLDRIRCRTQVLWIDACFAGGFAEVIDRPGRHGVFSSLETQESSEALTLKQGLMTSLIVRGLAGDADGEAAGGAAGAKDGEVTLAELAALVARVQPTLCPTCQHDVGLEAKACGGCGEPLEGENARQLPVIADREAGGVVIATPAPREPAPAAPGGRRPGR